MSSPLDAARAALSDRDPAEAAAACGFEHSETPGGALVTGLFLTRPFALELPGLDAAWRDDGTPVPSFLTALVVYHLAVADGTPPRGRWVSYAELPDGSFYVAAWRSYTPDALVRHFGDRIDDLRQTAALLGGEPLTLPGDLALRFDLLPRMPVALLYHRSDDEFPARADVLFDANASHQLPTDGCALLTRQLVSMLIAADPHPPAPRGV